MLKDKTFTYRGHTFQVRASLSEKGWAVQVYENERPISPPYKVTHETATNFATAGWGHAVEALMRTRRPPRRKERVLNATRYGRLPVGQLFYAGPNSRN